jgi:hypothetical protein
MKQAQNEETLQILEKVLSDTIELKDLTEVYSRKPNRFSKKQSEVLHLAIHFLTDAELRRQDKAYDHILRSELLAEVASLRDGKGGI